MCYYEGRLVFKYHKIGDFHEVQTDTNETVNIPSEYAGRFSIGDLTFGIEICYDHYFQQIIQNTPVDVQLLLSAYTQVQGGNLKPGGCIAHACSQNQYSAIWTTDNGWNEKPIFEDGIGGWPFRIYETMLEFP